MPIPSRDLSVEMTGGQRKWMRITHLPTSVIVGTDNRGFEGFERDERERLLFLLLQNEKVRNYYGQA